MKDLWKKDKWMQIKKSEIKLKNKKSMSHRKHQQSDVLSETRGIICATKCKCILWIVKINVEIAQETGKLNWLVYKRKSVYLE